ncbi:uncharacterized protein LOC107857734 [Capsicum annuum]|uniref:uncharacterized protein LOC107857734 n=1 Tax=Capsicum annuum TaxID=4072 RepID=UPI001FB0A083|nr:uncharacterized protein LOC107857734 [Capsicum annuum]
MELWESDECIKKSEINSNNRYGGHDIAAGTHTGDSITVGELQKKLAITLGRDPTPSELHLHVHTYNHDGKSFVAECSRLLHEMTEFEIDQLESYCEAVGEVKKKRLFGLGSEDESYFGKNLCACVPPSVSLPTTNLEEFVKQFIPALTTYFLPVVIERVGGIRVQEGDVLDPPPTKDDDIDS